MRRRDGFTLIELLVVIAIIAILAAILFPVFMKAKQAGQKASCMSGIKQLSAAFRVYADDNQDTVPPCFTNSQKQHVNGEASYNDWWLWMHFIYPYVKSVNAFNCPAGFGKYKGGYYWESEKKDPELVAIYPSNTGFLNASYGFNYWLGRYIGDASGNIKYSLIPRSTATPLLADCSYYLTGPQFLHPGEGWTNVFQPAARHGDMTVMSFVDQHVASVNRKSWTTENAWSSSDPIWRKWDPRL